MTSSLLPTPSRALATEAEAHMPPEWFTVTETATRLNLHISTIYRHLRAGTFPCRSMRVGRSWRISAEDVTTLGTNLRQILGAAAPDAYASLLAAVVDDE
jgi:excisionase family DNA binding protein